MWQAGYFMLPADTLDGGFGLYRMNLFALVHGNGGWSQIFDAPWNRDTAQDEGFSFLGLGMTVLVVLAAGEILRGAFRVEWRRIWPLIVAAACLAIFSASNRVVLAKWELFTVPLPAFLASIFGIFRASGRLFWPVFYMIYGAAFAVILGRFPRRGLAFLLPALFLLQVADSWDGMFVIHHKLRANREWRSPLKDEFWNAAAKHYRKILYVMPVNAPPNYFPLCIYAASNDLAINIGAFARLSNSRQHAVSQQMLKVLETGTFDPDALYIFEGSNTWNMARQHQGPNDRAVVVDGFYIFAPAWAACAECTAARPLAWNAIEPRGAVQ
jgi:hypothetical protein